MGVRFVTPKSGDEVAVVARSVERDAEVEEAVEEAEHDAEVQAGEQAERMGVDDEVEDVREDGPEAEVQQSPTTVTSILGRTDVRAS